MAAADAEDDPGIQDLLDFLAAPLLGRIVQIDGMKGMQVMTVADRDKDRKSIVINKQIGQAFSWIEDEASYLVHTFNGYTLKISEKNLSEYIMPPPEEGGCDLAYPVDGPVEQFTHAVASWLADKGFCMLQMSAGSQQCQEAAKLVAESGRPIQGVFKQETESAYLGRDNITQVKALPETEESTAMSALIRDMFATSKALEPYVADYFGHKCWASTSPWARVTEEYQEDIDDSAPIKERDVADSSVVEAYERFAQGRKTCVLYLVDAAGGEISLFPRVGSDLAAAGAQPVKLPVSPNKMLIFRHDQMSYTYQPKGASLALQSWMLTDIPLARQNLQTVSMTGMAPPPVGENAQVMMVDTTLATGSVGGEKAWAMWTSATDGCIHWPILRWDTEQYYTADDDWIYRGMSYTCHGGFIEHNDMVDFDNKHFGISDVEAMVLAPGQRIWLSVSYSCLYKSGMTRESLRGENMGVFLGDCGMDWGSFAQPWSIWFHNAGAETESFYGSVKTTDTIRKVTEKVDTSTLCTSIHNGQTCAILSATFDLRGPVQTADTACSSSLIAMQAGHKAMMQYGTDATQANSCGAPHSIISGGVNTLLNPISYVGNCAGHMLTLTGRSWTFDMRADGYQRGEGTACCFIKWSGDRLDIEERLACLTGVASGHDGRSASLTAPNGVAQQDIVKRASRMSGIHPAQISVMECHGTGTPLGDPIEVGALMATMTGKREVPGLFTTQKTNLGHLEACAGMAGFIKSVLAVTHSIGAPNLHLRALNPNIAPEGFPGFFCSELVDAGFSTTYIGLCSFGFGGANARADIHGRCLHGARNTGSVWTAERKEERRLAYAYGLRNSYKGYDKVDQDATSDRIGIIGSWDNWENVTMMERDETGIFTCRITLGDTRQESFGLLVAGDRNRQLFPAVDRASSSAVIAGPRAATAQKLNTWLIDGKRAGMQAGTSYKITFKCQHEKSLSWRAEGMAATAQDYYISGSWTAWVREPMTCVSQEDGLYEAELEVQANGAAEFTFRRGKERSQTIFVNTSGFVEGPASPVDARDFVVHGEFLERMKVQLIAKNADVDVKVISEGSIKASWRNQREVTYYVSGSFNDWTHCQMLESESLKGVYKYLVKLLGDEPVEYRILVDGRFFPYEFQGVSTVVPEGDAAVLDASRDFKGTVGSRWEIILDLNQDDPNRIIYHRPATHNEQHAGYRH